MLLAVESTVDVLAPGRNEPEGIRSLTRTAVGERLATVELRDATVPRARQLRVSRACATLA
jgi:hypothetical protein